MASLDELHRIFTDRDFRILKWAFCRLMCEEHQEPYDGYQLFLRSKKRGFMGDEELMKRFVLDYDDNIYTRLIEQVMNCLVDRGLLEPVQMVEDGQQATRASLRIDVLGS